MRQTVYGLITAGTAIRYVDFIRGIYEFIRYIDFDSIRTCQNFTPDGGKVIAYKRDIGNIQVYIFTEYVSVRIIYIEIKVEIMRGFRIRSLRNREIENAQCPIRA